MCVYIISKVRWALQTENAFRIPSFLQRAPCVPPRLHLCPRCAGKLRLGAGSRCRAGEGEPRRAFWPCRPALRTVQPEAWPGGLLRAACPASCLAVCPAGTARPGEPALAPGLLCPASGARALPDPAPRAVLPSFVALFALIWISCSVCFVSWEPIKLWFFSPFTPNAAVRAIHPWVVLGWTVCESEKAKKASDWKRKTKSPFLSGSLRREEGWACPTSAALGGFHSGSFVCLSVYKCV